jgi:hypothetical protein
MISKQEFHSVVSQVNNRFDWFTNKIAELEAEIVELKDTKPTAKKTTTTKQNTKEAE